MIIKNILFTLLIFVFFSCSSSNNDGNKLEIYLWDSKECNYCTPKNIYIIRDTLYFSNRKKIKKRLLSKGEQDTLLLIKRMTNLSSIDSTYYEQLPSYDYMIDLSISDIDKRLLSTSVYKDKLPKKLEEFYSYIIKISERDDLLDKSGKYSSRFSEVLINGLVSNENDTLYPSHESSFKIWKKLVETGNFGWRKFGAPKNIRYKVLFDYLYVFDNTVRDIEVIGITKKGDLFFKLKDQDDYFYTALDFKLESLPSFLGP